MKNELAQMPTEKAEVLPSIGKQPQVLLSEHFWSRCEPDGGYHHFFYDEAYISAAKRHEVVEKHLNSEGQEMFEQSTP